MRKFILDISSRRFWDIWRCCERFMRFGTRSSVCSFFFCGFVPFGVLGGLRLRFQNVHASRCFRVTTGFLKTSNAPNLLCLILLIQPSECWMFVWNKNSNVWLLRVTKLRTRGAFAAFMRHIRNINYFFSSWPYVYCKVVFFLHGVPLFLYHCYQHFNIYVSLLESMILHGRCVRPHAGCCTLEQPSSMVTLPLK